MFFLGGGDTDPKSRRGYEMAVIRLELDSAGKGTGVLNAAARVKPNADATNVIVDDYADEPVKLTAVRAQKIEPACRVQAATNVAESQRVRTCPAMGCRTARKDCCRGRGRNSV